MNILGKVPKVPVRYQAYVQLRPLLPILMPHWGLWMVHASLSPEQRVWVLRGFLGCFERGIGTCRAARWMGALLCTYELGDHGPRFGNEMPP